MDLWKCLNGQKGPYSEYRYPVGRWTKHLDPARLELCAVGYHLAEGPQVLKWLQADLYRAEVCEEHGVVLRDREKVVTCRARLTRVPGWNDRTARLFAADCAEHVLLAERAAGREPDERSWAAVGAARLCADGKIDEAAWSAARSAAESAESAAESAAWSAAWSAAESAAWSAA